MINKTKQNFDKIIESEKIWYFAFVNSYSKNDPKNTAPTDNKTRGTNIVFSGS